jgi:hypothetical protein
MYSIKKLKTFKGHEGESLAQGSLAGPSGKIVAEWSDDSWGGEVAYNFVTPGEEANFIAYARKTLATMLDFSQERYDVSTMHPYRLITTMLMHMSFDALEAKSLAQHAKKGIAYFRADPKAVEGKALLIWKVPYTLENVAKLRADTPDLLEIVNERLGLPFVDGAEYAIAQENKRLRALCRTNVVFVLTGPEGKLQTMKMAVSYSTTRAAQIRAKYPNLVEIVNERFL